MINSSGRFIESIHFAHVESGHGGRDITKDKVNDKFANVTKDQINTYLELCEKCCLKKSKQRKGLVVKPIVSNDLNSRCQLDLIDMQSQPDGEYKFIMNYQDHLTKFSMLRPLTHKTAENVAAELLDIFCILGAPHILQSDNGKEFVNQTINRLLEEWPQCKIVHGKPRHSQSQGSVERCNRDVESLVACYQAENATVAYLVKTNKYIIIIL